MPQTPLAFNKSVYNQGMEKSLCGVFAAAVTPLLPDHSPDPEGVPLLLDFLAKRGCHGALLFGTTGEGPSFAAEERGVVFQAAAAYRAGNPGFRLLAGTGTPSLQETITITRMAFEAGFDGVVVLPPYFYRKVTDDGLYTWFSRIIQEAVPEGGKLLGYHIPPVSGVALSIDLISRLKSAFPDKFAGIKDSSADAEHARRLGERFGEDLDVFNGTDRLFSLALESHASGCITALANLCSPDLRLVWESFQAGKPDANAQARLNRARAILESYPPAPPFLKALLPRLHGLPAWPVRPPLLPLPGDLVEKAQAEFTA